jgi:hypothetical protein
LVAYSVRRFGHWRFIGSPAWKAVKQDVIQALANE